MLSQMQPADRRSSSSDEPVPVPMSPTSAAILEQDLQNINEQTETLLADKLAAEQKYASWLLLVVFSCSSSYVCHIHIKSFHRIRFFLVRITSPVLNIVFTADHSNEEVSFC